LQQVVRLYRIVLFGYRTSSYLCFAQKKGINTQYYLIFEVDYLEILFFPGNPDPVSKPEWRRENQSCGISKAECHGTQLLGFSRLGLFSPNQGGTAGFSNVPSLRTGDVGNPGTRNVASSTPHSFHTSFHERIPPVTPPGGGGDVVLSRIIVTLTYLLLRYRECENMFVTLAGMLFLDLVRRSPRARLSRSLFRRKRKALPPPRWMTTWRSKVALSRERAMPRSLI
jgi:hypothetical protein